MNFNRSKPVQHRRYLVPLCAVTALLLVALACSARAAGVARSDNFSIYVPDTDKPGQAQRFAAAMLKRAEAYRTEIARGWFETELPAGAGRTTVYVEFSEGDDVGLMLGREEWGNHAHTIFLHTTPKLTMGATLKHEVAHAVSATVHPHPRRLPKKLEEEIALTHNSATTAEHRARLKAEYLRWRASQ